MSEKAKRYKPHGHLYALVDAETGEQVPAAEVVLFSDAGKLVDALRKSPCTCNSEGTFVCARCTELDRWL